MMLNSSDKAILLHDFDIDFEYGSVHYLENLKYYVVFNKEMRSENTSFVAKVYDKKGDLLFTIPFPHVEIYRKKISLMFAWCWEVDGGLRIVFNTSERIMRDFWHEFNFEKRAYTNSGMAY